MPAHSILLYRASVGLLVRHHLARPRIAHPASVRIAPQADAPAGGMGHTAAPFAVLQQKEHNHSIICTLR